MVLSLFFLVLSLACIVQEHHFQCRMCKDTGFRFGHVFVSILTSQVLICLALCLFKFVFSLPVVAGSVFVISVAIPRQSTICALGV